MAPHIRKVVGLNIRVIRTRYRWSQEKLAEMADLDRTYVGRIERGEKNLGLDNLARFARALGVQPASLLRGAGISPRSGRGE